MPGPGPSPGKFQKMPASAPPISNKVLKLKKTRRREPAGLLSGNLGAPVIKTGGERQNPIFSV
ncbi:MAG: hypothetical protein JXR89_01015, partial [Deltaproteobacteria bacterium]|nr:hypothetical protein [Deltaproteobacteria bacterium]